MPSCIKYCLSLSYDPRPPPASQQTQYLAWKSGILATLVLVKLKLKLTLYCQIQDASKGFQNGMLFTFFAVCARLAHALQVFMQAYQCPLASSAGTDRITLPCTAQGNPARMIQPGCNPRPRFLLLNKIDARWLGAAPQDQQASGRCRWRATPRCSRAAVEQAVAQRGQMHVLKAFCSELQVPAAISITEGAH